MIYLDNAATAKPMGLIDRAVVAKNATSPSFFNPSSLYAKEANAQLNKARSDIAELLGAQKDEIYFTSGATESNNIAIFGASKNKTLKCVTSSGEHSAVYEPFVALKNKGFMVEFASLNSDTTVKADEFMKLASRECGFASLIEVSNETGAINDIEAIFKKVKKTNPRVILHSDGVQGFLKTGLNLTTSGIDLYSISGHKIGAQKGIGVLYIKRGLALTSLIFGAGQEKGIRSGTVNVEAAVSLAQSAKEFKRLYNKKQAKEQCVEFLIELLGELNLLNIKSVVHSQNNSDFTPNILSMSVIGLKSEILQRVLADKDKIYIGLGSACAASKKTNRVLVAAGKTTQEIESNIRLSFGLDTTKQELQEAAKKIALRASEIITGQIG